MGSYTDEEINRFNADIEDVQQTVKDLKIEILNYAFNVNRYDGEKQFSGLKYLKDECEYIYDKLERLKWQPYDTPQHAVDMIGQKE